MDTFTQEEVTYSQVTWKYKEEDGYHGEYDIEYEDARDCYTELIENEYYALEWVVWEKVINDGEDFEDIERWDNSIECDKCYQEDQEEICPTCGDEWTSATRCDCPETM